MARNSRSSSKTSANIGFEKQILEGIIAMPTQGVTGNTAAEIITDNQEMGLRYENIGGQDVPMAAEKRARYGNGE